MNNDLNDVALPKGATFKTQSDGDQEILKVLNSVVGETSKESGYMILLGNGDKVFLSLAKYNKLAEKEA